MPRDIKTNTRLIGEKTYWTTDNPNVVIELELRSQEIHLDKLDARVAELRNAPQKFEPTAEILLATSESDKAELAQNEALLLKVR